MGYELGAPVGRDVRRNPVLGENVEDEQVGELFGIEGVVRRDEDGLLGEPIYYDQDRRKTVGAREVLDEVHGDGVPRAFGDRKLLQSAVGEVTGDLRSRAGHAGLAVVSDEELESGPSVVAENKCLGLVLSPVACRRMVVTGSKDPESEVVGVRDIDAIVESKETVGI